MWYLDGTFTKADNKEATDFVTLAESLDFRAVYADNAKGTRVTLLQKQNEAERFEALVLGLRENQLSLRGVHSPEGIAWLRENVK